jgi:hypothetical protein
MKRDLELIKLLLQEVEGEEPKPDLSAYSQEVMFYHYELMDEAGLIVANLFKGQNGLVEGVRIERLTNLGHDFLDTSRNATIWKEFQQKVLKLGGGISLSIATDLLKDLGKKHFGL